MTQRPPSTAVLGLGNVLMHDDALGPHVIARLRSRYEFGTEVTVEDLGTPGLDLVPHIADHDCLIVVDTVRSQGEPGTLRLYDRNDIVARPLQSRVGPHDPGLKEAILAVEFARQRELDVALVGVIPDSTEQGIGLTPRVAAKVLSAELAVVRALEARGHRVEAKAYAGTPELWWEAETS